MLVSSLEEATLLSLVMLGIDIYFVWLIIYYVLKLIKANVRAIQILKGLVLIFILHFLSNWLNLRTLNSLIENVIAW